VVMNLVINAGEAVSHDGGSIHVTTAAEDGGRWVTLIVEDNGCGMTPEVKARIFDPFFTTKFTGRGLGLAAVMGIVRAHRATIDVETTPGRGTRFRVRFPASEHAAAPRVAAPASEEETLASLTVLVIDDEEMVLKVARLALEQFGASVLTAASGMIGVET